MKRSWFGLILLLVLLVSSLGVTWAMEALHQPVSRSLSLAAEAALAEDWTAAAAQASFAQSQWNAWDPLRRCFADHNPIEDIDSGFHQLEAYLAGEETADFAALCRELQIRVEAVGQAHRLNLWNVL